MNLKLTQQFKKILFGLFACFIRLSMVEFGENKVTCIKTGFDKSTRQILMIKPDNKI